ncbi:MAG: ATP-binding protein [Candidatus Hodarchaeota archaeon]
MSNPSLLIVDDDDGIRETFIDIFEDKGYTAIGANTGKKAIQLTRKNVFNIALIDICLPDMDGLQLLKELKKITRDIICIIITGNATIQNAISALEDKADGYFIKPLLIDNILQKIDEFIEKQHLRRELRKSESKFKQITENLNDLVVVLDEKLDFVYLNKKTYERTLGFKIEENLSYNDFNLAIHADDEGKIKEVAQKCFRDIGKVITDIIQIKNSKGSYLTFEFKAKVYEDDTGEKKLIAILRDITEKLKAQRDLEKLNSNLEEKIKERTKELERANRAKSIFLANVSHELRTPLNSIIGFSEALKEGFMGALSIEQEKYINDILESGEHLLILINDILDLSKVEAGKMEVKPSIFSIENLITKCINIFKEKIEKNHITTYFKVENGLDTMVADEQKITQILFNLIGNALKFTKNGGEFGINVRYKSENIIFSVWDTGIGIAEEDIPKLFKPFEQIETSLEKKSSGTGLGLHFSKKLVKLHGGDIWVESKEGEGSVFSFSIPRVKDEWYDK